MPPAAREFAVIAAERAPLDSSAVRPALWVDRPDVQAAQRPDAPRLFGAVGAVQRSRSVRLAVAVERAAVEAAVRQQQRRQAGCR